MKNKKLLIFFLCLAQFLYNNNTKGQEFNCIVDLNAQKIQTSDRDVFETLKNAIFDFMNNRKWSTLSFMPLEKVECNISIILNEKTGNNYKGSLTVQIRRPVYNSTYNTVLFNFQDRDFEFSYEENEPLNYADQTISSNLTAVLAFYAYYGLGLYFDSFAYESGMSFFDRATEIVNYCQSMSEPGWRANARNQNNRYWLVENYTNGNLKLMHEVMYLYHRMGLDKMYEDVATGRKAVLESIVKLDQLNQQKTGLIAKQVFLSAKKDEIVNIFKNSTSEEKTVLLDKIKNLDPASMGDYQVVNIK
ncbi:MAG: DUF4835 family protein [Bacteroidales bacterium]|jgi:hypothetical protein|nr:DUF4835 family protein [Bacteroidales bacterium]